MQKYWPKERSCRNYGALVVLCGYFGEFFVLFAGFVSWRLVVCCGLDYKVVL
jgi:hypothetical protein